MKIEIDSDFEMGDDPEATKFLRWALPSTLAGAYIICIAIMFLGIVFANWLMKD